MSSRARPRALLGVLLVALLSVGLAACGREGGGLADELGVRPDGTGLRWRACGDAQCATLTVPLDHDDPAGPTIELAVLRVRTADPARRIGSLVLNPGGPGGSGVEVALQAPEFLPDGILERFDVVGWDPRGVGASTAVDCTDDLDPFFSRDTSPDTPAELEQLASAARDLAVACGRAGGAPSLLPHLSTVDTARDLDALRAALGDEQLTYLGWSYGTLIGAVYADRFPGRVRAMVLDGAVDPALGFEAGALVQARGFEHALDLFLEDCRRRRSCEFGGDDPAAAFDALLARTDRTGIAVPDDREGRRLNGTLFDLGVATALYDGSDGWDDLGLALAEAEGGDGWALLELADQYLDRRSGGRYGELQEQFWATSCVDVPAPRDLATVAAVAARVGAVAPRFGATTVYLGLPCAFWPATAEETLPTTVRAAGAAPIVVIGSTDDPATPLAGARALADALESGVLVVLDSARHTAFPSGVRCLDDAVTAYLVDRRAPAAGLSC